MASYLLTPAAEEDLRDIWRYTAANWSKEQANIYLNDLFDCFESIAAHPMSGQSIDWIRAGIDARLSMPTVSFTGCRPRMFQKLYASSMVGSI